jgi:hypothetical protein
MDTETQTTFACYVCGEAAIRSEDPEQVEDFVACAGCRKRYPAALIKATVDPLDYALKLTTGEEIRFESATIHGDFAHLSSEHSKGRLKGLSHPFDRGLDVAIDQIVWCADAPGGP